VAYPMAGILSRSIEFHRKWSKQKQYDTVTLDSLEHAIHSIAFAWDQVLAGDVDDILEGFDLD